MSQKNGEYGKSDNTATGGPSSELDIYGSAIESTTDGDDFLSRNNLGLGNYSEREYWQQISAFRQGMFADAAFRRMVLSRAETQTKRALAEELWDELSERTKERKSKRRFLREKAEEEWQTLSDDQKAAKMKEVTGIGETWDSPFYRMLQARHEASRSKFARLLDNLFGRVSVQKQTIDTESEELARLRDSGRRR
jgi:hypothetical protein